MFLNLIIIKIDAKLVGDILNSENTPIVNTHLDSILISDYLSLILSFEVAYFIICTPKQIFSQIF